MDTLITDFHIHSKYSHDSLSSPENILKKAKKVGLERIAITDHGTIRGSIETQKLAKNFNIEVIIGSEVKTDCGDIIGLYLNDEIKATKWEDVVSEIQSQGGISILPHPYREHQHIIIHQIAQKVDFIEAWNSRSNGDENKGAQFLANVHKKKITCGSDAHCLSEIGLVKVSENLNHYLIQGSSTLKQTISLNIKKSRAISIMKKKIRHYPFI